MQVVNSPPLQPLLLHLLPRVLLLLLQLLLHLPRVQLQLKLLLEMLLQPPQQANTLQLLLLQLLLLQDDVHIFRLGLYHRISGCFGKLVGHETGQCFGDCAIIQLQKENALLAETLLLGRDF